MRAFVTGATGTVGGEVCRALLARGIDVRVGARDVRRAASALPAVEDVVGLDFEDPKEIDVSIFESVDALFFMTPLIDRQIPASRRVLEAAVAGGVSQVVRLSSRSAGWDFQSALRAWHREIEDSVRGSGARWTILRPCSFFQNFVRHQSDTIRSMSSIIVPQGNGLIPYIDAADIGDVVAECIVEPGSHHGRTYVLTGSRAYGVKGVAAEIGRVIGRPITYIDVDADQARDMMARAGIPPWLVEAGLAVFAHAKAGGEAEVDPSLSRILGRPPTTLSEFVERNRAAWE